MTDYYRDVELMGIVNGSPYMGRARASAIPFEGISFICVCKLSSRSIPVSDMEGRTHTSYPSPLPQPRRPNVAGSV